MKMAAHNTYFDVENMLINLLVGNYLELSETITISVIYAYNIAV